jgi:hypothetical protein
VTRKSSGPTGQMEMEKGPTGTRDTITVRFHRSDGPIGTHDMQAIGQAIGPHRSDGDGE